jgi:hypothetical protein
VESDHRAKYYKGRIRRRKRRKEGTGGCSLLQLIKRKPNKD